MNHAAGHRVVRPVRRRDTEDIRIRDGLRAKSTTEHVANHAANARRRPAVRLDGRGVIVRFDLDGDAIFVVKGNDARVVLEDRQAFRPAA